MARILDGAKGIERVFKYPDGFLERHLESDYFRNNGAKIEVLPIKDLDDYKGLETYHTATWGNKQSKYRFDPSKMKSWGMSVPYAIRNEFGKLRLGDGRHRMKALMNMGYTHVPIIVVGK